jgi:trigger factor
VENRIGCSIFNGRKNTFMNVTVENLAPCKKLVRVELDAPAVDAAFAAIEKSFQKEANLPGFRPGKAPIPMVVRKYEQEIKDEVKRKLIGDSYRDALKEKNIDVLGYPDIEEIQFGRGQSLLFAATIETPPEFQLPEYKGLPVKREAKEVTDDDVAKALDLLREQRADFKKVERPLATGDIAVVNYSGTSEGKPLTEIAPTAQGLTAQQGFWIEMKKDAFIPGFSEQLLGAKAGDKRTVNVDFPADFVSKELAGHKGVYEVEIVEVREKTLPALDDAFAKSFEAENLEKLREGVRRDLESELKYKRDRETRGQIVSGLLGKVNFDLPEGAVANETRNVVYNLVQENAKRGVSRDIIEKEKDAIYSAAATNAKERVKLSFLVQKIAEKEEIKVSQEEVLRRIQTLASMYQIPPDKFIKDLQKRNGIVEIYDQLSSEKVMEFLENNAAVETVPAKA